MWVVLFHIHAFSGAHLPHGLEFIARAGSTPGVLKKITNTRIVIANMTSSVQMSRRMMKFSTRAAAPGAADLVAEARATYERAIAAQKAGDWAKYGEEIRRLGALLAQLK